MKYKMIDLCAGIGGIRKGFELTGAFKNVLSGEIDKYACLTYKHLYGEDPTGDITSESFKKIVEKTPYDVLLAGFPCQSFSRAGKQEGFLDSTRGTIFFDIADIAKRTNPKIMLLENVDNLLSHNKGNTFHTILNVLVKELGYKVIGVDESDEGSLIYNSKDFLRNSKDFGVPQNRPRVYIICFKKEYWGKNTELLQHKLPTGTSLKLYNSLHDVLEMGADLKYFLSSGYLETLEKHKNRHKEKGNGFGYQIVNLPSNPSPISNALLATGGSGKERNLVIDNLNNTAGKIASSKKTPLNDRGIRAMTPREWGKLQGFINYAFIDENGVDQFSFPAEVSNTQQYKQFGNAVTIPTVRAMAEFIISCIEMLRRT
ncbi:DNA (cytosine-5-)-methyltransferase [Listeria booriae]|uniref:DNA (cytosine-5-)-methyltransferase n=1 Tax=Listeria booriae TaxID=1552123 RepID=UPI001623463D|nr:DNA (cytosine-5-)-methyltransferase [Listeria booriae]MBC1912497.1 DNA (cytosine-5-)-methyltransferase [Listeria booriae]